MKPIDAKERQAERRALALQLRKDGYSYAVVAEMLTTQFGNSRIPDQTFSTTYVRKIVREAIKDIYREDTKSLVTLELERLDSMQLEALDVLRSEHVVINSGAVVRTLMLDDKGKPVFDAETGLPRSVAVRDDGPRLAAIDRLLKIQERRARLLGLDKPTKIAPTDPSGDKPATPYTIVATPQDVAL